MTYKELLDRVGNLPVFTSGLLLAGDVNPVNIHKQLSRWTTAKKIIQLRRGVYTLAEPYRKIEPHPFTIGNRLVSPSYVSLQSALEYYNLIPEAVPQVTSITSRYRTQKFDTPLGLFAFHHIKSQLFFGFSLEQVDTDQFVYLARPEKALLDLIYLTKQGHSPAFLEALRLQNCDQLDLAWMEKTARDSGMNKLIQAVKNLVTLISKEGSRWL